VLEEDSDVDPFLEDRPMRTSAEMNMKHRPREVDMESSSISESGSGSEDEGPADGSQFFPGSGFF